MYVEPVTPLSAPLAALLEQALSQPAERVRPLDLPDGGRVWLKRVEHATGLMRLQKGDGLRAFQAERDALLALCGRGLPVAEPLAAGDDFLLLPDLGPTLSSLLDDPNVLDQERLAAFRAAGRALAALHGAGLAHGRPALRDMCWSEGLVRLIDLERFQIRCRSARVRAMDLVIFVHTWFARVKGQGIGPELEAAFDSYRASAPLEIWPELRRLLSWLQPVTWLAKGVLTLKPRARDWLAVDGTLVYLRGKLDERTI